MKSRSVVILGAAALVAIVAGIWLTNRQASTPQAGTAGALYPELKAQLESVSGFSIVQPGGNRSVEIVLKDGRWTVAQRANHPADESKVRALLRSLAEAKPLEEKTSNPKNYPSLGVQDISDAGAGGVQIELTGSKQPVQLIIGKQGPGSGSRYVRRAGEPQSWLVDAELDAPAAPDAWLRKRIVDVSADRVQSATVTTAGAKPYTAQKATRADAQFTVDGLPKGKSLSSPSATNGIATALSGLTLNDVQARSQFAGGDAERATIRTFDGLSVELEGWRVGDKRYVALKSSFDPAQAERFKVATTPVQAEAKSGGEAAAAKDKESAVAEKAGATAQTAPPATRDIAQEATKVNAEAEGWVYEIAEYKYDAIFKPLKDMLGGGE